MKVITIAEAEGRLAEIIYAVSQGESIVLKDGDREVALTARIEEQTADDYDPELEAELLKAAAGPFTPYSRDEMRQIVERAIDDHRRKQC